MPIQHLDVDLLDKLAVRIGKSKQYLREQISRKAGKLSVSSLAAQFILAKQVGIGITHALNRARPEVREEVRSVQVPAPVQSKAKVTPAVPTRRRGSEEVITGATINRLIQDEQLRDRCSDLLRAKKHFDRVFREATTVLDDRLKKNSGISNLNPADLFSRKGLEPRSLKSHYRSEFRQARARRLSRNMQRSDAGF